MTCKEAHPITKMIRNTVIATLVAVVAGFGALGQSVIDSTLSTKVVSTTAFIPKVAQATRKTDLPKVVDTVPPPPVLKYDFLRKQFPTELSIDTIRAAKIKGLPLSELDRVYARLAFGSFTTTLADVHYNSLRSRKQAVGVHIS